MAQIIVTLALYLVLVIPMGTYLYHIAAGEKTFADPVFNRVDNAIYKVCRITREGMNWKQYTLHLLMTNAVMVGVGYLVLRLQSVLLANPNQIEGMEPTLSFNTIISFMTNTNLQHYSGESGLSYLSQMLVIIFMMFTSAATGYAACMAFCRGLAGKRKDVGNFYEDVVRIVTRVLVPISIIGGLLLIWQGVPETFQANQTIETIEGKLQDLAMGPVAALEIIKHLGTNGGGFFGANSTIITNLIELYSMMILPGACVIVFGKMTRKRKKEEGRQKRRIFGNQGRTIFAAMSILFLVGLTLCFFSESAGNPVMEAAGVSQSMGSMEGKEVRFGVAQSALFTTTTTSFTTGTVNNMHDTLTPLGGMKKIEGKEMKLVALVLIIHPLLILGFSALAVATSGGLAGITNEGFHGLTQVLYEFASSAANNGSGFEGLADNTYFWNITTGLAMFFGRYVAIVAQLAIAGSLLAGQ